MSNMRFKEDGRAFAAKRAYEVMCKVAKKLQLKHAFVFPTGNSACIATKIDRVYCVIPHAVTRPAAYDRINVTQYELEYLVGRRAVFALYHRNSDRFVFLNLQKYTKRITSTNRKFYYAHGNTLTTAAFNDFYKTFKSFTTVPVPKLDMIEVETV